MSSTNPQTPRGQEILRSLQTSGEVLPATPRTIADRVSRARKAGLKTAQKAVALTRGLSVPIGAPRPVPRPKTGEGSSSGTPSEAPVPSGREYRS